MEIRRALVSVSDREGVAELVAFLLGRGVAVVSTSGTAAHLKAAGHEVVGVETLPGVSGILGGRVKTLTPQVFAGILADRDDARHMQELDAAGIAPIDLVAVNLYPFERALAAGADAARLVEEIDVGGVALARAAAKNHAHVAVLTRPQQYPDVIAAMQANGVSLALRRRLAHEAFLLTSRYEATIAQGLAARFAMDGEEMPLFPDVFAMPAVKLMDLRYGENHHQMAALYRDLSPAASREVGLVNARRLSGKELSYNNVLDGEEAVGAVREFPDPTVVIIKHATPSGVASAPSLHEAWSDAFATDTYSPFGGVVAVNRPLDLETAQAMRRVFLELVLAPAFEPEALALLSRKKNLRLLEVPGLDSVFPPPPSAREPPVYALRGTRGGLLVQQEDRRPFDPASWRTVTKRQPTPEEAASLLFAVRVVKHVRSNALVFAKGTRTVGIGGGQTARVDASWIACHKGGGNIRGSVLASDAFFPFRDAVDVAAENGVVAIVQPGGSIRDDEVVAACDEHGIAMVMTGHRVFHH